MNPIYIFTPYLWKRK